MGSRGDGQGCDRSIFPENYGVFWAAKIPGRPKFLGVQDSWGCKVSGDPRYLGLQGFLSLRDSLGLQDFWGLKDFWGRGKGIGGVAGEAIRPEAAIGPILNFTGHASRTMPRPICEPEWPKSTEIRV